MISRALYVRKNSRGEFSQLVCQPTGGDLRLEGVNSSVGDARYNSCKQAARETEKELD